MADRDFPDWFKSDDEAEFVDEFFAAGEVARRRILRPHWENADRTIQSDAKTRRKWDEVLKRLQRVELAFSTGCLSDDEINDSVPDKLRTLLSTAAIARYINDYDCFGVRFLAARLKIELPGLSCLHPPAALLAIQRGKLPEVEFQALQDERKMRLEAFFEGVLEMDQDPDVQHFLRLIDGSSIPLQTSPGTLDSRTFRAFLQGRPVHATLEAKALCATARAAGARLCIKRAESYRDEPTPFKARLAIYDAHWLATLNGADLSSTGTVTYSSNSWTGDWYSDLCTATFKANAREYEQLASALAPVGLTTAFAWNLIQGNPFEPEETAPLELEGKQAWARVYEAEIREVAKYRAERTRDESSLADHEAGSDVNASLYQARRSLVGLALSGGGIRSATFNLGVLEALKEKDLLRRFDYLSTVSGGGYIGAWLVGNSFRRRGWLRKSADWSQSIDYLRRYSNYLSPQVGFLSADTWTMLATWGRNTLLMQLLVLFSMAFVLIVPHVLEIAFAAIVPQVSGALNPTTAGVANRTGWEIAAVALLAVSVGSIALNLKKVKALQESSRSTKRDLGWRQDKIHWILAPMILAAFFFSLLLWWFALQLDSAIEFSALLRYAWSWWLPTLSAIGVLVVWLSIASLVDVNSNPRNKEDVKNQRKAKALLRLKGFGLALPSFALLYVMGCAILLFFLEWRQGEPIGQGRPQDIWYVFTFGPPMVVWAFTLAIVVLLGLLRRLTNDERREWWSRLGGWLIIYGGAWMMVALGGIFAPLWIAKLSASVKLGGAATWIATTWGGLMAGKSESTNGEGKQSASQMAMEWLARLAPVVFVAGLVVAVSSGIHALLLYASGNWPGEYVSMYWTAFNNVPWVWVAALWLIVTVVGTLYALRLDINVFSLNYFYRNRLVRCYLGATRDVEKRQWQPFTGFDPGDDIPLKSLRVSEQGGDRELPFSGPFPIINCALNLGGSADLELHTRQSASFTLTPLHAGSGRTHLDNETGKRVAPVGYAGLEARKDANSPLTDYYAAYEGSPLLGQAMSVSGAAASPNQGYHTSPLVAFLMTVFNARLGWWFANPGNPDTVRQSSPRFALGPVVSELFGFANDKGRFLNISDGGHFENLGIYELVRRRCRVIVASDAECDPGLTFGSLGNVIRVCEVDFGAKIEIDVGAIRKNAETGFSTSHTAVGKIKYSDGMWGLLIYIKSSLTSDTETAIREYKSSHATFPHETTADQFFSEDQFESYRVLGREIGRRTLRDVGVDQPFENIARELEKLWTAKLTDQGEFVDHTKALMNVMAQLRSDAGLDKFREELAGNGPPAPSTKAHIFCNELFQVMENAYLGLALDDTWEHPDNVGWKELFIIWAKSETFREAWQRSQSTYGVRFRMFCERELGLPYGDE